MKTVASLTLAAAALSMVAAFAPAPHASRSLLFRSPTALGAVAIPNPMKSLPWVAKKEKERETRRIKTESAKLHRELGIAEDATFEEIQEATQTLINRAEADGDPKKKIKIEIAKDKIMQIRLNERLAGIAHVTEDAAAQSAAERGSFEDDVDDIKNEIVSKSKISWFDGLIKKPDEAHKKNQIKTWGLLTLICFVIPPVASQVGYINWIFAGTQIMNRGVEDSGAFEGAQMGKDKNYGKSMAIAVGVWLSAKVVFGFLASFFPSLVTSNMGPVVETTMINVCLAVATMYISTYKA
mgnify:CR=1 FL=1|jgi:hypothetical protein